MDLAAAEGFLRDHDKGVLLTITRDGRPQASNILYGFDDGEARISVTDSRAKTKNLQRDPRASLHVTTEDFWQWLVLEGDAEVSSVAASPDDEVCTALRELYRQIKGEDHPDWDEYDRAMIDDRRRIIRLRLGDGSGDNGNGRVYGQLA